MTFRENYTYEEDTYNAYAERAHRTAFTAFL